MVVFASAYMEMAGECLAAEHCTLSHPRVQPLDESTAVSAA